MDLLSTMLLKGGQQATALNGAPQAAQTGQLVEPETSNSQPFQAVLEKTLKGDLQEAELALAAQNASGMLAGLLAISQAQPPLQVVPVQEQTGMAVQAAGSGQTQAAPATQAAQIAPAAPAAQSVQTPTLPLAAVTGAPMPPVVDGTVQVPLPDTKQQTVPPPQPKPEDSLAGRPQFGPQTLTGSTPSVPPPDPEGNHGMPIGGEDPVFPPEVLPLPPADTAPVTPPQGDGEQVFVPPPADEGPVAGEGGTPPVAVDGGTPPPASEADLPPAPGGDNALPPGNGSGVQPPTGDNNPAPAPGDADAPAADGGAIGGANSGGPVRLGPPVSDEPQADDGGIQPAKNRQVGPPIPTAEPGDARMFFPTEENAQAFSGQPERDGTQPQAEDPFKGEGSNLKMRPARELKYENAGVTSPPLEMAPPDVAAAGTAQPPVATAAKPELARLAEAHQPEVLNQISRNMEALVRTRQGSFHLQLEPQDLGKIDLRFVTRADGLHVVMAANQPETGAMLERNLMDLRQSLTQMGVQIGNLSVSYGQSQAHSQAFAEQQGQTAGRGAYRWSFNSNDEAGPQTSLESPRFKTSRIDYLA